MRVGCWLLVVVAWAAALAAADPQDDKQYVSAKEIFYAKFVPVSAPEPRRQKSNSAVKTKAKKVSSPSGSSQSGSPSLKYQIIQRMPDGGEVAVDPDTAFHSQDRIRISVESNIDGFLYVVQQGSTGSWTVLFPTPRVNQGRNVIQKGTKYEVPAPKWFVFDANPGTERVMVFLSKTVMKELPGFDAPVNSVTTVSPMLVASLNDRFNSRDLVFEKDTAPSPNGSQTPAVYVANPKESGEAVLTTILLKHN
jgi:hypothetical protein